MNAYKFYKGIKIMNTYTLYKGIKIMNKYTLYKGIKIMIIKIPFERNYTYQYNDNCRVTECTK